MTDFRIPYRIVFYLSIAIAGILFYSCENHTLEAVDDSSFGLLQSKILTPSCAISGCHASTNDNTFIQHHLVLDKKVSYSNLVNVAPTNTKALADNLLRVTPGHSDQSLLAYKLLSAFDEDHDYGNLMPLGLEALTKGQVEFVRNWIDAGAPETGTVADKTLLDDTTSQREIFVPLSPPPVGMGFQVIVPEFTIAPNFEREFFVYKKIGNTEPIYVNRFEIKMMENSHHFVLYDFNSSIPDALIPPVDVMRDIRNPDGTPNFNSMATMPYDVFLMIAQTTYIDYKFPEGVALAFPANAKADFNSHYVNKQAKAITGEVNVNFYTIEEANVAKVARLLSLSNQGIILPALQRTTLSKTFLSDKEISIISLTSHTHQLGEKFVIKIKGGIRDGEVVYTNLDWHHPEFTTFDPPLVINVGEGLTSEITYNNTKNKVVTFGLTSEDEMGFIFGYYIE